MRQHQYTPPYDRAALDSVIDDIDANWRYGFNPEQEEFARDIRQKLVGLQGPPGTGKTYTVAPAAVARGLSYDGDGPFTGQVSAHAHDAVDEVLDDANDVLGALDDAGCLPGPVRLLRIHPSGIPAGSEEIQGQFIEHYSYNYNRDTLVDEFEAHFEGPGSAPILVFGPPVTIRGLIDKLVRDGAIDGDHINQLIEQGSADLHIFQYALVDEASMLDLPLLFLLGAFVTEMGQVQLAGDHRQLPPIQQHDWREEDRRTIEEHTPSLSALDMVRFVRDELDNISYLARKPPAIPNVDDEVMMHRLVETYRLPEDVANLLSRLIYHPGDDIVLKGRPDGSVPRIPQVTQRDIVPSASITDDNGELGLPYALDPNSRLTVVVHKDDQSTDNNPVERALVEAMTNQFTVTPADQATSGDLTGGVVVPYRRQRAALRSRIDEAYEVNTVEKFQGGERSIMFVSMTASDKGAIYRGADFLLDPRRFNVAVSRMIRKVVVVASESLFQTVPTDLEDFEDQSIWLRLYDEMDIPSTTPDWSGIVGTFVGDNSLAQGKDVRVEVYNSTGFTKP